MADSSNGGNGPSTSRPISRAFRHNLRQATLILPQTGERVKRAFTLNTPSPQSINGENGETDPLLRHTSSLSQPSSATFPPQSPYSQRRRKLRQPGQSWSRSTIERKVREGATSVYSFVTSPTGTNILKCSLAYLLGSMATFVPAWADFLGRHNDGKHMAATVTVYFHAARSAGSMVEATYLALAAFVYAAIISFTSMGVSLLFENWDMIEVGHGIVLVVFAGGGMGFVGWTKQKLGNPLVNVACSLTSLAMITVLTKEGAIQEGEFSYNKVVQVLKMVIMGITFSTGVTLLIKPTSARRQLRQSLVTTTDHLAEVFTTITRSFLSGSEDAMRKKSFTSTLSGMSSDFSTLAKQLKEARNEHYVLGTESEYHLESRLVKCLERLAHNIGGLRSAATTQFALIKEGPSEEASTTSSPNSQSSYFGDTNIQAGEYWSDPERFGVLASIDEVPEEESAMNGREARIANRDQTPDTQSKNGSPMPAAPTTPDDIFAIFISHLGPPMKSLAYTLKGVLNELPFESGPEFSININSHFKSSLMDALKLFSNARREALRALYENRVVAKTRSTELAADFEEVAASCGYFSSSLIDLAEETMAYLDTLEELKVELEKGQKRRSWHWLAFWRRNDPQATAAASSPGINESGPSRVLFESGPGRKGPLGEATKRVEQLLETRPISRRIWHATRVMRRDDIKYAIKVGVGVILYAMWSYIPATRPIYAYWRGEWGLISYMLVCSMTIGASNTTGYQRFYGTCLGAVFAVVSWLLGGGNPYLLAFIGWCVSLGCFYIIVGQGKGPLGRFIMLTYNLSALYAYSLSRESDDDELGDIDEGGSNPDIWEIVMHRVVAVMIGCIWGIVITRLIWPISAREKLRDGISLLWLRMGLIWKRDPLTTIKGSQNDTQNHMPRNPATPDRAHSFRLSISNESDPSSTAQTTNSYMDIRESMQLRRFLNSLTSLRTASASEFELKGPFPDDVYKAILAATDRMLDSFHAMNVVISKDLKASPGETALLAYTRTERLQLNSRISHLFSVLASSMKLAYPLSDALPPIESSRDRLLAKIWEFRQSREGSEVATNEDYEVIYAYALVTGQIAQDIGAVGSEIEKLYGVLNEEDLQLQ